MPIIKPKRRDNTIASSPDTVPSSVNRCQGRKIELDDPEGPNERETIRSPHEIIFVSNEKEPIEPIMRVSKREFTIETPEDTEYEGTLTTVDEFTPDPMTPSRLNPCKIICRIS